LFITKEAVVEHPENSGQEKCRREKQRPWVIVGNAPSHHWQKQRQAEEDHFRASTNAFPAF
jgi:hypothetical protein